MHINIHTHIYIYIYIHTRLQHIPLLLLGFGVALGTAGGMKAWAANRQVQRTICLRLVIVSRAVFVCVCMWVCVRVCVLVESVYIYTK